MPRIQCGSWPLWLVRLHFASDIMIFAAYCGIPIALLIARKRGLPVTNYPVWATVSFAFFIFACGTTHLVEAFMFWHPYYFLSGYLKVLTAVASWATIYALAFTVPSEVK